MLVTISFVVSQLDRRLIAEEIKDVIEEAIVCSSAPSSITISIEPVISNTK